MPKCINTVIIRFSPILRHLPVLHNFDLDSSVSNEAVNLIFIKVARSALVGAFDFTLFGKILDNN